MIDEAVNYISCKCDLHTLFYYVYCIDVNEVDQVKSRSEQPFPFLGEPVCVVCGWYGEYIYMW